MARIPLSIASRSLETGGVVQVPANDPLAGAVAQAGKEMADLGERYRDQAARIERFKTLQEFDAFDTQVRGTMAEKATTAMPAGGVGFHESFMAQDYDKRRDEFLAKQPPALRAELEARFTAQRARISEAAAKLELNAGRQFQAQGIADRTAAAKNTILQTGPEAADAFVKDIDTLIDAGTLSPAEKAAAKQQIRADLAETKFLALKQRDPAAAQRVAAGWGLSKGLHGAGIERAQQILRHEEGYRSTPYWDVNAHRVGYGSDTITDAAGNVRQVKPGDAITREDAERDLARRTKDFMAGARNDIGAETFDRLHPNAQAALTSVAYNYGSLPKSVVAAAKSGDTEAIAGAVGALGANKARRQAEAAIIRSTGDGSVPGAFRPDEGFNDVPAAKRLVLAGQAELAVKQVAAAEAEASQRDYNAKVNDLQTRILDNQATTADIAQARKDGWLQDADTITKLTNAIARRDKGLEDTQGFALAASNPNFQWNPLDSQHKDFAEAGFKALGGNMQALETVAEKTGVVPASAAVAIRGALVSGQAQKVEAALQTAANLVGSSKYPDIFAGVEGGKDLTEAAWNFRHLVYGRGMSAADATRKIMEERAPGYEFIGKAKIKKEDVDAIVKKQLSDGDLRSAFDPSFMGLGFNPNLGFDPQMRQRAMGDYEEAFRDHFMKIGDVSRAKDLAIQEMKRTWGVSRVSGSSVVMKYPPERAPSYAGVENVSDHIATQAIDAIRELNGAAVQRNSLRIDEVSKTGELYVKGQPPVYSVSYSDKNGVVHTIPRPFFADPVKMRDEQTRQRGEASAEITARTAAARQQPGNVAPAAIAAPPQLRLVDPNAIDRERRR